MLDEYRAILQNYLEHRWSPAELSGGRFCEIVFTILDGYAKSAYATAPTKPPDFVGACRQLEKNGNVPRSFKILIPRLLPALYEIRNNRGVGHVGGDVNPNHMDATAVVAMANWVMGELVRVLHSLDVRDAQEVVDALAERRIPVVWEKDGFKRVLNTDYKLADQVLLLCGTAPGTVAVVDLLAWTEASDQKYFIRLLRRLHKERKLEFRENSGTVELLPPGAARVASLLEKVLK